PLHLVPLLTTARRPLLRLFPSTLLRPILCCQILRGQILGRQILCRQILRADVRAHILRRQILRSQILGGQILRRQILRADIRVHVHLRDGGLLSRDLRALGVLFPSKAGRDTLYLRLLGLGQRNPDILGHRPPPFPLHDSARRKPSRLNRPSHLVSVSCIGDPCPTARHTSDHF